ncbi:hypothetical protein, partial [Klebsiella pneumoniae]|uniref:hypothetical protein n=1 Tax=Klebsiella pneumoniae TaxID=573 RepID=UPI0025A180A7
MLVETNPILKSFPYFFGYSEYWLYTVPALLGCNKQLNVLVSLAVRAKTLIARAVRQISGLLKIPVKT